MTIDNKRNLIQQSYIKPEMTQTQLVEWARREFRLRKAPARNTVSDIIKNAAKIMKEEYGKGKRRKPLKVKAPDLEKKLDDWWEGLLAPIRGVEEDDKTEIDYGEEDDSDEEVIDLMLKVAAIDL
ncbi:hypothetical protein PC129_g9210 [Phytophthora cactorum]|uniref:ARS-binding protein 1 N-terminal domain-containing protein n=1 Tax=Phytophthora cactorum TaxID=29920 RepID=A0A8T1I610_9STRA|nr:hypothetical protein PC114_g7551 [Phytophthora cactorum]KAG2938554.1 hypothetical protein PC117_g11175 [Phytophthora cactorum]KAG3220019.1 hypothetical protein PC129_g9210 [Phytophthora cactorum]